MATAKRLKSGMWRVLAYAGTDEHGKKKYKSITDKDKRRCELKAAQFANLHRMQFDSGTFRAALSHYIDARTPVLSPSTIRGYKSVQKYLEERQTGFCGLQMGNLTKDNLQNLVNSMTTHLSAKSVKNYFGLVSAVLKYNDISIPNVRLPETHRPNLSIPDQNDIDALLKQARGTEMEVAIMLGAYGGMRRGEICALTEDSVTDEGIIVESAVVIAPDKSIVKKSTKTKESTRFVPLPPEMIARIRKLGVPHFKSPDIITSRFEHIARRAGCPAVRFHDLRHFHASYLHAKGVPDAYIMARCGWKTDNVMKRVYRHTLNAEEKKINEMLSNLLRVSGKY